jgi:D-alanine-D-alanine ligase
MALTTPRFIPRNGSGASLANCRIALLHNPKPAEAAPDWPDDCFEEYDSEETIAAIKAAIEELGAVVVSTVADRFLPERLANGDFQFVFNIAEGSGRRCREAIPAAICELLNIPCTGSDLLTLGLTLDKAMARRIVAPDVAVPKAILVERVPDLVGLETLRYPVMIKPNDEGSSKGIRNNAAVVDDPFAAREHCQWLSGQYGCPVLVEEFISGIEVTVGIIGNSPSERILGVMEIAPNQDLDRFVYSVEVKRDWRQQVQYHVPARLGFAALAEIEQLAIKAFRLLGCRDCARIDFRLDAAGKPFFLECNPLPGLNSADSDMVLLCQHEVPYKDLIQGILLEAVHRTSLHQK